LSTRQRSRTAAAGSESIGTPVGKAVFTTAGVKKGLVAALPLAPGVLVYGLVFGVLASGAGLSALEAVLMSAAVYSGSAQLAALQNWQTSHALAPVLLTVLMINARYVLYGAALRPWMGGLRVTQAYPSLFFLGDGNWALALARHEQGEHDAGFVLGSGITMFVAWIAGTLWGRLGSNWLMHSKALGLDTMIIMFCAAMAVSAWRGRNDFASAAAAIAAALVTYQALSGGWAIVAAGLAGAATASIRSGDAKKPPAGSP